jgi:hypothetical protein
MNAALVSRTLSLVPDRMPRMQTGTLFNPAAPGVCAHPERVAHLARFLEWLGPLREVTMEDQREFGLLTPYGKPTLDAPTMDEESDAEPAAPTAHPTEDALT